MTKIKVPALFITGAVLIGFILGSILSGQVRAESDGLLEQLHVFNAVATYVDRNYVEEVDNKELVRGAIRGMLEELDPHSTYVDPEAFARMSERNTGEYEGIGISFEIRHGWITVISAIEGGPSAHLGIRPGDQIIEIEGQSAKGLANEDVIGKLKGPKGSQVNITVARPGLDKHLHFTVTRETIPIYSVPYSFMLDDGQTGYIRMIRFSATTSEELEHAMKSLEEQGMTRLVLDIRSNSGGLLNQAIEVADKFIDGNQVIVYTKGRIEGSSQYYYSTDAATHPRYPLIVLVNHGSASASEIVSGAIQDHDRGLVTGVTTFGKGLVQRQYMLPDGSALLLTVARYYTPSGRLIQRSYANREEYLEHWRQPDEADSAAADTTGKPRYYTIAEHRTVYGGGGITPDVRITASFDLTDSEIKIESSRNLFEFANAFANQHFDKKSANAADFLADYQVPDDALQAYIKQAAADTSVGLTVDELTKEKEYIRTAIKREVAGNLWGLNARYQVIIKEDPEVAEAMTHFPEAAMMAKTYEEASTQNR